MVEEDSCFCGNAGGCVLDCLWSARHKSFQQILCHALGIITWKLLFFSLMPQFALCCVI